MSVINHTLNKYDMLFRTYLDLLPLYIVCFVLANGDNVLDINISLAVVIM